ncbi:hypothetical protein [Rubrivivax gelatinosus]|uniref:hypothetical protein n=1 Tax=Rubrivivax gelatinosus TaxID=28068 RepID=UPI0009D99990|nr:hypothetical protein [Rubrivivax gelatinosus]
MPDVCDRAGDRMEAEAEFQRRIAAERASARELSPHGCCHNPNCELPVVGNKLFCDTTCSGEYERLKATSRRPS